MDFAQHLRRQAAFSERTFGSYARPMRTAGVIDHIKKELREIEADPQDLEEWIDLMILAFDGAMSTGARPSDIERVLEFKQAKNEARKWPDWKDVPAGKAIEHVRDERE